MQQGSKSINLQDSFLNQVRKDMRTVSLCLTNGTIHQGTVRGFDNFTVILEKGGKNTLIYKHAIATIE